MKWNFLCPICREGVWVPWEKLGMPSYCRVTGKPCRTPGPADEHDAYVDTREWPAEIERVVCELKGLNCTVPGCRSAAQTLDHRVPYSAGGRTSVANLFPICHRHNRMKADEDYGTWLKGLPVQEVLAGLI